MAALFRILLLSATIHFLLMLGVVLLADRMEKTWQKEESIEIALVEPAVSEEPERQIVRQAVVPDSQIVPPEDETLARFLSEKKQRVRAEQRAAQTGMTENRQATQRNNQQNRPQQSAQRPPPREDDGYRDVDISKELAEMNRMNQGQSQVGEALPNDVKIGSFTALNTDQYLYYSFYARIEEQIRYRWENRVMAAIQRFDNITMMNTGNRNWVTQVEFLLDREGFLKSALVMKESGVKIFDMAAINAFREARVFPNPPPEMIKEDGFIHIKYSFSVNFRPPTLSSSE